MSKDLDAINARLDNIESMLRELLGRSPEVVAVAKSSGVYAEIARVRAVGGDLIAHLKAKAKRQMQEEAATKKAKKSKNVEQSNQQDIRGRV